MVARRKGKSIRKDIKKQRQLARALTDLNRILTQKDIAKRFRITRGQVSRWKKYKKQTLPSKKKQDQIISFYWKLLATKKNEDIKYKYVVQRRRIVPIMGISQRQIRDIIQKYGTDKKTKKFSESQGIKKAAKKFGVSTSTIRRWVRGKFPKKKSRQRKKLNELHKKAYRIAYDGIFLLSSNDFHKKNSLRTVEYYKIEFVSNVVGPKAELMNYARGGNMFAVHDSIVARPRKFKEKDASQFIENLKKKRKLSVKFNESVNQMIEFVEREFRGKSKQKLMRKIRRIAGI